MGDRTGVVSHMHEWEWQDWQGVPYLRCRVLAGWEHGFFTQQTWPQGPSELVGALQPEATVYRVKQVHGNVVLATPELEPMQVLELPLEKPLEQIPKQALEQVPKQPLAEADGIVTAVAGQSVWACTADCTPVLIGDERTGQVAAVHAGWRGTAAKVVPVAVQRLLDQGSRLEDLRAALGPAIAGEVYQLPEAIAAQVGASLLDSPLDSALNSARATLEALAALPDSPLQEDPEPGKVRLHVRQVSALQLRRLGLEPEQIAVSPHCTFQSEALFFSHRRNPLKKVQWSGIVSR